MHKFSKIIFWVGCACLIAFNGYRAFTKSWGYANPTDFRDLFVSSKLMNAGLPLYNDSVAKERWIQLKTAENFTSNSDFGTQYVSISVYPPHAFVAFNAVSLLTWKQARILWWFVCAISLFIIGWISMKLAKEKWPIALLISLSASFFAFHLGQPMLVVLAYLSICLVIYKEKPIFAGILLGFATLKFTLAIPFFIFFLAKKEFKLLLTAGLTVAALLIPVLLQYPDILSTYLARLNEYYGHVYTLTDANPYTFNNSEFTILLNYFSISTISFYKMLNAVGQLIGFALIGYLTFKNKISDGKALLGLLLVSFVFSYHLTYDPVVFVPILAMLNWKSAITQVGILLLFILSLPINSVFDNEIIQLHYPMLCLLALVLYIYQIFFKEKVKLA